MATPKPPVPAVVAENERPGTGDWLGPDASPSAAAVYASATDAVPGDVVGLHVSTDPATPYRILVYRLGWYGGAGAREVTCLPSCDGAAQGAAQPPAAWTPDGIVAPWPVTDQLRIGDDWVSGYYEVRVVLLAGPEQGSSATTFVIVRSLKPTRVLVQVPVNTWQAYNSWGGHSLYDLGLGARATHVSFDRPYLWHAPGGQGPLTWELPFVRFVERSGYDVSYQSDVYTDAHPESLTKAKLVAVAGHDEYWSKNMRDGFEAARTDGVNLAFLGANAAYWQVRMEADGRSIYSDKSMYDPNPVLVEKTAMFREIGRPECNLIGIQHQGTGLTWSPGDYTVQAAAVDDPWLNDTGFQAGDVIPGIVSVESDTIPNDQSASSSCGHPLTVFFHRERGGDGNGNADATRYVDPSGAIVFASGSHQFSWGLDGPLADPRLQAFMRNALDAMTR